MKKDEKKGKKKKKKNLTRAKVRSIYSVRVDKAIPSYIVNGLGELNKPHLLLYKLYTAREK